MAGAGAESPLVRVDLGIVPAGQGSPIQNGETLANEHGKFLARVRGLLIIGKHRTSNFPCVKRLELVYTLIIFVDPNHCRQTLRGFLFR